ncbi:MAG: hypothetical protein ACQEV7_04610 [Bacillota bacterium]
MKKAILKTLDGLFTKADNTEVRYEQAMERKQEEIIQLQLDLKEASTIHAEFHKMKLLGDIQEEVYEVEKLKVEELQKKLQEAQKELHLIEEYKTTDIKAVVEELEAERGKASQDNQKEMEKLKLELMEAKLLYLHKMKESKEKYDTLVAPTRKLDMLKIKLGIKKNSYVSDSFQALNNYSIANGGYEVLYLEKPEIYNALAYGKIPERLEKLVQGGKDKGMLK